MTVSPSQTEISTIANCNIESQLLAVKINEEGGPIIVTLDRKEMTLWLLFLRFFNLGKLADYRYGLNEVSQYLCNYNWSQLADEEQNTEQWQAYYKVCQVAGKAFLHRQSRSLWHNVSKRVEVAINFQQNHSAVFFTQTNVFMPERCPEFSITYSINYNPACKVIHVLEQLKQQFGYESRVLLNQPLLHPISTQQEARRLSIRVEQDFPPRNRSVAFM